MARQVLLNFFIAVVWMFVNNEWTTITFLIGYLVGFVLIFMLRRFFPGQFYGRRLLATFVLLVIFVKELFLSNLAVIKQVIKPRLAIRPGIVALPIELKTPWEITLLANLITLTPGTLTVDVSNDNKMFYIHALDIEETEQVISGIKETFEKRIMEVTK